MSAATKEYFLLITAPFKSAIKTLDGVYASAEEAEEAKQRFVLLNYSVIMIKSSSEFPTISQSDYDDYFVQHAICLEAKKQIDALEASRESRFAPFDFALTEVCKLREAKEDELSALGEETEGNSKLEPFNALVKEKQKLFDEEVDKFISQRTALYEKAQNNEPFFKIRAVLSAVLNVGASRCSHCNSLISAATMASAGLRSPCACTW
jgi:vacuolar-type H+-ATPase subunit I/STV1